MKGQHEWKIPCRALVLPPSFPSDKQMQHVSQAAAVTALLTRQLHENAM